VTVVPTLAPRTSRSDRSSTELAARLRLVVGRLARQLRRHKAGGLTASQLSALATVGNQGPLRLTDLAAIEGVGAPAMTRLVASLDELDLVRRATDPNDRRSCLVALSERGRTELEALRRETTALLARRVARLSEEQRELLRAALPVLEAIVREDAADQG
jgi:DNA-binding MarR family transcriptional regulator